MTDRAPHYGLLGLLQTPTQPPKDNPPKLPEKQRRRGRDTTRNRRLFASDGPTDEEGPEVPEIPPSDEEKENRPEPLPVVENGWHSFLRETLEHQLGRLQREVNQDFEDLYRRLGIHP
uniref:Protein E4 n=1 Tax=Human papillomavirus type 63 TaxID=28311 RepID=VE4_HPV63|nr:RecName: Full=Protein E4 [Human papillomavirus type 63]